MHFPRLRPVAAWYYRWWLHLALFIATLLTTSALGARLAFNFKHNLPAFDLDRDLSAFAEAFRDPTLLLAGLPYSLTLLLVLSAHEFGHWFACRFHSIGASLPFFLPAPTFIGTFGAFIRFRSAVKNRFELFDVGVAGPLAGFLFAIPALGIGLALSKAVPGIGQAGEFQFGTPLLIRGLEWWLFPGVAPADIYLHPVARAGWVGLFATALNLLPIGQLDGGHIVYACFGERHKQVSTAVIALLFLLGFVYWPWWAWSVVLFFLGRRHFYVFGRSALVSGRRVVFYLTLLIFVLCFIAAPVQYNSEQGWLP
ncbi:MAG: site-2 protease family protein [Acidobacteria bacterium]|nr:site-2 protease family protein [Acidobacteriota bacterium]